MKTLICLTLLSAATLHAQTYTSDWSEFDSGRAAHQANAVTHVGVFSGWLRAPSQSANYHNQQGDPSMPIPTQTPGAPTLHIARAGNDVRVFWADSGVSFVLQEKTALAGSSWSDVPGPYSSGGGETFALIPATEASRFYRLRSP